MSFSIETRKQEIANLKNEQLDLLIVGGGITGAGVALQASAAGMKTALIDMQDFGAGTSSRSTRLVHGGIRYLKNFDVQVVSDTVKERAVVQHIAPHMTQADPMLLPIYDEKGTTFTMFSVKVAMDLYDHLAGIEGDSPLTRYANYTIDKDEALKREPQLNPENLEGAGVYLDYQNNDSRLVLENIKKAHDEGGVMLSRIKCIEVLHDANGVVKGARVKDLLTGEEFDIKANVVLNAAGPWSDEVRATDSKSSKKSQMRPTKGIHLVVDQSRLSVPQPTYFGSGTDDGRMIFTIPREGKTYFGTTDTDYKGDLENPKVDMSDVDYLLNIINKKYPSAHLTLDDVESSWAGIRPLVAADDEGEEEVDAVSGASDAGDTSAPSAVSRGSSLTKADDGLITLAGGKLTDYRVMANGAMEMVADTLSNSFNEDFELKDSAEIKVSGGDFDSDHAEDALDKIAEEGVKVGLSKDEAHEIASLYGSNAHNIFQRAKVLQPAEGLSLAETAALNYSLDEEMTLSPVDYLMRRTYHILFKDDGLGKVAPAVMKEMAKYFDWDDEEIARQQKELDDVINESELVDLKAKVKAGK